MASPTEEKVSRTSESEDPDTTEHDPHYDPIVSLPLVDVHTNEEDEEEMVKLRARLYRYDTTDHEWKERGTGEVKLLRARNSETGAGARVRVVMRRERTHKLCANHFVTPHMQLAPHCGSARAFNWSVLADYTDHACRQLLLAIKFANTHNAQLWKEKFTEAQEIVRRESRLYAEGADAEGSSSCEEGSSAADSQPEPEPEPEPESAEPCDRDSGLVVTLKHLKVNSD